MNSLSINHFLDFERIGWLKLKLKSPSGSSDDLFFFLDFTYLASLAYFSFWTVFFVLNEISEILS